jgi:autotransporter-associated beta strand protein
MQFNSASGVLILRDQAGGGGPDITFQPGGSSGNGYGTIDLTGHYCDVKVGTLTMGNTTTSTSRTHNFSFNNGLLDINNVNLGVQQGSGAQTCSLNISGGNVSLGTTDADGNPGSVVLATGANGYLNITGGTVTLFSDITRNAGSGTATINLSGPTAILDLNSNNVGTTNLVIGSFNYDSGTLRNLGTVYGNIVLTGTGSRVFQQDTPGTVLGVIYGLVGLTKTGTNALTFSGACSYPGPTIVSNGTLIASAAGVLGTSNLTVAAGAKCSLQNPGGAVADTASIYLNGVLDLTNGLNETVARLFINGTEMPGGTWNATRDPVHFTGAGNLIVANSSVTASVPLLSGSTSFTSQFQFQITGTAGYTYTVQASTNMLAWTNLFTTNPLVMPFWWQDSAATNFLRRFYRVSIVP